MVCFVLIWQSYLVKNQNGENLIFFPTSTTSIGQALQVGSDKTYVVVWFLNLPLLSFVDEWLDERQAHLKRRPFGNMGGVYGRRDGKYWAQSVTLA